MHPTALKLQQCAKQSSAVVTLALAVERENIYGECGSVSTDKDKEGGRTSWSFSAGSKSNMDTVSSLASSFWSHARQRSKISRSRTFTHTNSAPTNCTLDRGMGKLVLLQLLEETAVCSSKGTTKDIVRATTVRARSQLRALHALSHDRFLIESTFAFLKKIVGSPSITQHIGVNATVYSTCVVHARYTHCEGSHLNCSAASQIF